MTARPYRSGKRRRRHPFGPKMGRGDLLRRKMNHAGNVFLRLVMMGLSVLFVRLAAFAMGSARRCVSPATGVQTEHQREGTNLK